MVTHTCAPPPMGAIYNSNRRINPLCMSSAVKIVSLLLQKHINTPIAHSQGLGWFYWQGEKRRQIQTKAEPLKAPTDRPTTHPPLHSSCPPLGGTLTWVFSVCSGHRTHPSSPLDPLLSCLHSDGTSGRIKACLEKFILLALRWRHTELVSVFVGYYVRVRISLSECVSA